MSSSPLSKLRVGSHQPCRQQMGYNIINLCGRQNVRRTAASATMDGPPDLWKMLMKTWRPELASVNEPVRVLIDHQNLKHFKTTKQLNQRQARWAKFLLEFNFRITYRPGKEGEKPDTLTRLAQDRPKGFDDARQQHQFQTLLKIDQLDDNVKKALAVIFYANKVDVDSEIDVDSKVDMDSNVDIDSEVEKNENIVDVRDYINQNLDQHSELQQILEQGSSNTKMARSRIENSLEDLLDKAYQDNEAMNSIITAKRESLRKLPAGLTNQGIKLAMGDLTLQGSERSTRLYMKGRMYVPDNEELRLFLLQQHHDPPIQGHPGYKTMLWKLLENWYWLEMPQDCKRYAINCSMCRRTKAYNTKKQGLLNPLPIPHRKWVDLLLDFVVDLLQCHRRNRIYCHILVVVDRLTKRRLYEPLETLSTGEFIEVMN